MEHVLHLTTIGIVTRTRTIICMGQLIVELTRNAMFVQCFSAEENPSPVQKLP